MKPAPTLGRLAATALAAIGCCAVAGDPAPAEKTPGRILVEGNTAFAVDLYHQLKKRGENLFFSPFSVSTSLAMTYAGAGGNTSAEMVDTLHFAMSRDEFPPPLFVRLNRALHSGISASGQKLSIANGLFSDPGATDRGDPLHGSPRCHAPAFELKK